MLETPKVILKPRAARPFFARHPWVFVTSIERVTGSPEPGDEVEVLSREGKFIARGLFNPASSIRVRLYRWEQAPLDASYLSGLVDRAVNLRLKTLGLGGERAALRLIFSEADGLSGLNADLYADTLVAQFTGLGLYRRREVILEALKSATGARKSVVRGDPGTARLEGLEVGEEASNAADSSIEIIEHGITYRADVRSGQKTGFYLDQRDNRLAAAGYAAGRSVLDLYCHSGGFALTTSIRGGATEALGIDSSAAAIETARFNASVNQARGVTFEKADVSAAIERLTTEGRKFGMVVCDPPKFARDAKGVEKAVRAYLGVNRAALDLLEPEGILVTCSCSGLVDRSLFCDILGQAAESSGRSIQILEQRGQAPDHPVSASCLESEYLKCFICRVS